MADEDYKGPKMPRRLFLGGAAMTPVAMATAPAALTSPVAAAGLSQALVTTAGAMANTPSVLGVITSKGLNFDLFLTEAMRLISSNEDEFIGHHLAELDVCSSIDSSHPPSSITEVTSRFQHIIWKTRYSKPDNHCFGRATYTVHSPICDIFSQENKFAYFVAHKAEDDSIEDWENWHAFTDPDSEWNRSLKLLKQFGLSQDSTIPLDKFLDQVRERAFQQIVPKLQELYRKNPEAVARELASQFRNTAAEDYRADLERILGPIRPEPSIVDGQEPTSFSDLFDKISDELKSESSKPPKYELHRLPPKAGSTQLRFVMVFDGYNDFHKAKDGLLKEHPELQHAKWNNPCITVDDDLQAAVTLNRLADQHTQSSETQKPTTQIASSVRHGTAMACALTAKEFRRGGQ